MDSLGQYIFEKGEASGWEKGITIGKVDITLAYIKSMMKNLNMTLEQAFAALEIPQKEQQKYIDLLAQQ